MTSLSFRYHPQKNHTQGHWTSLKKLIGRRPMISFVLFACGMAKKKNKRELSPSALTECISNEHHNNVKGNSRAIFSSIVLSLSRSYYRRFFNNSAKRKFSHGCMVTTWVSRQLTECRPKRSVRLFSILKNGHLTSAYFLTSGNSTL